GTGREQESQAGPGEAAHHEGKDFGTLVVTHRDTSAGVTPASSRAARPGPRAVRHIDPPNDAGCVSSSASTPGRLSTFFRAADASREWRGPGKRHVGKGVRVWCAPCTCGCK